MEVLIQKLIGLSSGGDECEFTSFEEFLREDTIEEDIGDIVIEDMLLILESRIDSFFVQIDTHDGDIFCGELLKYAMSSFGMFLVAVKSSAVTFLFSF